MINREENIAFLLTGSNLGDRLQNLEVALHSIQQELGNIVTASSIYETAPWGLDNQEAFLNQVLKLSTNLTPNELLEAVLAIEQKMGRVRQQHWGSRLIDIDLLFFNEEIITTEFLTLPHPYLHQRNFVLVPMAEISPYWQHPIYRRTIEELVEECGDVLAVELYEVAEGMS